MIVLSELLIICVVKLLQAIAMTMGMGVVCVCMMDDLRFAVDLEPGAYLGGDGQLGASRLKILICIYVSKKILI